MDCLAPATLLTQHGTSRLGRGERLRALRTGAGLTLEQLGSLADVDAKTVSDLELSGRLASASLLYGLLDAGIDLRFYLFGQVLRLPRDTNIGAPLPKARAPSAKNPRAPTFSSKQEIFGSAPLRSSIGVRLNEIRACLGLTVEQMAAGIGISVKSIREYEANRRNIRGDILSKMEESGVNIGYLLLGTLHADPSEGLLRNPLANPIDLTEENCMSVRDEIIAIAKIAARKTSKARKDQRRQLTRSERRSASMFAQRWGCNGPGTSTYEAVGSAHGDLTKQRAQVIVAGLEKWASQENWITPHFDRLERRLANETVRTDQEPGSDLATLIGPSLDLAHAVGFAQAVLRRSIGKVKAKISVGSVTQRYKVIEPINADLPLQTALRSAVERCVRAFGACHLPTAIELAKAKLRQPITLTSAKKAIASGPGFEWLRGEEWLWLGPNVENAAQKVALKMLCVAHGTVSLWQVHKALTKSRQPLRSFRAPRHCETIVPVDVLEAVLSSSVSVRIEPDGYIILNLCVDARDTLSDTEIAVRDLIIGRGGAACTREIRDTIRRITPISEASSMQWIIHSPILESTVKGLHQLCGTRARYISGDGNAFSERAGNSASEVSAPVA